MLAEMKAERKTDREEMLAEMKAERKADREEMLAEMKVERKADRELLLAIRQEMNANTKAIKEKTDALVANIKNVRKETTACHSEMEATKTDPDPGMMQSAEEHQDIPKKDAAVIPVKGRKKRRRARKPAAGRREEPNELTRGDCGSGKKLAAACKKITRRATVAWRKKNVFRKIVSQENCGPRSTLTAAGIMNTRHASVAWPREKFVRKDCTRNQRQQATAKGRKDGGLWNSPKCNSGIKDPRRRQQLRPGNEKTSSMIYKKAIRLEIVKQASRISSVFRKIRKWTMWRGRPPPKRKKRSCTE
jgi:hypothetical protein